MHSVALTGHCAVAFANAEAEAILVLGLTELRNLETVSSHLD